MGLPLSSRQNLRYLTLGVAGLFVVLLIASCGTSRRSQSAPDSAPTAWVGLVRCDPAGVAVLTPVVRPQADGVHLRITNSTGHEMELDYDIDGGHGGGGGAVLDPGVSQHVLPFVAQRVDVACYRAETEGRAAEYQPIIVEDPGAVAKSSELECTRAVHVSVADGRWKGTDVMQTARAYLHARALLRPGDRIQRAVSPGPEFPIVRVMRELRTVAALAFLELSRNVFTLSDVSFCAGFAKR